MLGKISLFAVFFSMLSGTALAGPFGLEQGEDATAFEKEDLGNGVLLINPPSAHSAFESYMVNTENQCGLTKVIAIGKSASPDSTGAELRSEYEEFKATLSTKYGSGTSYEYLNSGSIWDDYSDWVMSINVGDRSHVTYWVDEGDTFPDNIGAIGLEVKADGSRSGYITLSYEFDNHVGCTGEARAEENEVL